jgi:hypothetical protein
MYLHFVPEHAILPVVELPVELIHLYSSFSLKCNTTRDWYESFRTDKLGDVPTSYEQLLVHDLRIPSQTDIG